MRSGWLTCWLLSALASASGLTEAPYLTTRLADTVPHDAPLEHRRLAEHGGSGEGSEQPDYCEEQENESHTKPGDIFFFPLTVLCAAVVFKQFLVWTNINIPETVLLFIFGVAAGVVANLTEDQNPWSTSVKKWAEQPPVVYLYVLLPVLVFNDALHLPLIAFGKTFLPAVMLATIGVLGGALFIAVGAYNCLPLPKELQLTVFESITLGAIMAATDPVAALAVLKRNGASHRVQTLVSGEALMNDGTAIVLTRIFHELAQGCDTYTYTSGLASFCTLAFGGVALGLLIGVVSYSFISICQKLRMEPAEASILQVVVSVVTAFSSFAIAEGWLEVSGVLATMTSAVTINALWRVDHHVHQLQHTLWEFLEWVFNTLLFSLAGVEVGLFDVTSNEEGEVELGHADGRFIQQHLGRVILSGIIVILFALIARAIVLSSLWFPMKYFCPSLKPQEGLVLWWSGLRGAVGLLIALEVAETRSSDTGVVARQRSILLYTAMLVVVTLSCFGPTIGWFIKKLGLTEATISDLQQQEYLTNVLALLSREEERKLRDKSRYHCCPDAKVDGVLLRKLLAQHQEEVRTTLMTAMSKGLKSSVIGAKKGKSKRGRIDSWGNRNVQQDVHKVTTEGRERRNSILLDVLKSEVAANIHNRTSKQVERDQEMAWLRRLYLQLVARRLAAHIDIEAVARKFTVVGHLEAVVQEDFDFCDVPLRLWERMQPSLRLHRWSIALMKRLKANLRRCWAALCCGRATIDGGRPSIEVDKTHISRLEIAATMMFICCLEEALEVLQEATRPSLAPSLNTTVGTSSKNHSDDVSRWRLIKLDVHIPLIKLADEVHRQTKLAKQNLSRVPPRQQSAVATKELATAILLHRRGVLEAMDESGLWSETNAVEQHHAIAHQLREATDTAVLNTAEKIDKKNRKSRVTIETNQLQLTDINLQR